MFHAALKVSDRLTSDVLDSAARHESEGRGRCLILAMRQLALGHSVAQVQGCFGLGKSQLYEWVQRYNAQGLERLRPAALRRNSSGRYARGAQGFFPVDAGDVIPLHLGGVHEFGKVT